MKKIAIIGAGFSGLATAWHLLRRKDIRVELFDPKGIGGGASGIAAGLLHPFAGLHAKLNWHGREGYAAACELLAVAAKALNQPVAEHTGLLRLAVTAQNTADFTECAQNYEDAALLMPEECQRLIPGILPKPGLFLNTCMTVNTELYLMGLWDACRAQGATFAGVRVSSLSELSRYDAIVIASGAEAKNFPETSHLTLTSVKGQIIELEWPADIPPLRIPVNSNVYLLMTPDKKRCIVGATYERDFSSEDADPDTAIAELFPKAVALLPFLENAKILACTAGVRASTPNHHPILKQVTEKCWVLAGMGSKGLLYHGLFAEKLASLAQR